MALKPYIVTTKPTRAVNGVTTVAVMAADAAQAKAMANDFSTKDRVGAWDNATATEIAATSTDWIDWTFRVLVSSPAKAIVADVTVKGDATNNTIDEVGALLVTALNATAINGAAYNSTTQSLKVAETTDNIGNHTVQVTVRGPNGSKIPGIATSIVHEGSASAALTFTLPADADVAPAVIASNPIA